MTNEQKYELAMLRDLRALCPKKGSGVDTIEISSGGRKVTLTADTRKTIQAKIDAIVRRPR